MRQKPRASKKILKKPVGRSKPQVVRKARAKVARRGAVLKPETVSVKPQAPLNELRIEEAKFYTGGEPGYKKTSLQELEHGQLPAGFNEDVLVLQVRDPWWAHAYWDISFSTVERLKKEYASDFYKACWILRAYDISFINFDGTNAHRSFDTKIDVDARNWYLNLGAPGTSWCIDIGLLFPDGRFVKVIRSNAISLPLDGPSWVTDEEWMIPEDAFRRLYGMSVGLGPNVSSPVGKLWQERLKRDVSSGAVSSLAVSSPVKGIKKEKPPFWLVVDTELIVYGATEADARVTVQGQPVRLRKDGTFTLRFALPDGKQVIPVEASSAKTPDKRVITPIVTRKTTRHP